LQLKSELPGSKERDSHRYTDERHICRLGRFEVQVPNWRKNNAKLPPSQSCSYWCCIHEDIDRSKNGYGLDGQLNRQVEATQDENNRDKDTKETSKKKRQKVNPIITHVIGKLCCKFEFETRVLLAKNDKKYFAVTFEMEKVRHTCPGNKTYLAPLTPRDERFLIAQLMKYESTKEVFQKVIAPLVNGQDSSKQVFSRLHMMTDAELNKYAKKCGLDKRVQPGEQESLSTTGLYKKKSTRKTSRILCDPEPFVDFSKPIVEAQNFSERVRDAKLKASSENFASLRGWLRRNTVNRLKVFAAIVLKIKLSGNMRKDGLVDRIISEITKGLPVLKRKKSRLEMSEFFKATLMDVREELLFCCR